MAAAFTVFAIGVQWGAASAEQRCSLLVMNPWMLCVEA